MNGSGRGAVYAASRQMESARMKASRAAVKTMRTMEGVEAQLKAMWQALERIEAKLDAVMFADEPEPEEAKVAKGK